MRIPKWGWKDNSRTAESAVREQETVLAVRRVANWEAETENPLICLAQRATLRAHLNELKRIEELRSQLTPRTCWRSNATLIPVQIPGKAGCQKQGLRGFSFRMRRKTINAADPAIYNGVSNPNSWNAKQQIDWSICWVGYCEHFRKYAGSIETQMSRWNAFWAILIDYRSVNVGWLKIWWDRNFWRRAIWWWEALNNGIRYQKHVRDMNRVNQRAVGRGGEHLSRDISSHFDLLFLGVSNRQSLEPRKWRCSL